MNINEITGNIPPVTKLILFIAGLMTITCYMEIITPI